MGEENWVIRKSGEKSSFQKRGGYLRIRILKLERSLEIESKSCQSPQELAAQESLLRQPVDFVHPMTPPSSWLIAPQFCPDTECPCISWTLPRHTDQFKLIKLILFAKDWRRHTMWPQPHQWGVKGSLWGLLGIFSPFQKETWYWLLPIFGCICIRKCYTQLCCHLGDGILGNPREAQRRCLRCLTPLIMLYPLPYYVR